MSTARAATAGRLFFLVSAVLVCEGIEGKVVVISSVNPRCVLLIHVQHDGLCQPLSASCAHLARLIYFILFPVSP